MIISWRFANAMQMVAPREPQESKIVPLDETGAEAFGAGYIECGGSILFETRLCYYPSAGEICCIGDDGMEGGN